MPDAGAGISVSTLSVETSSSGSSALTYSPSALSHRVTVPSVTLSPSWGIVTETAMALRGSFGWCGAGAVLGLAGYGVILSGQPCACSGLPARAMCASPIASERVGWAWMSEATSSACASQL